MSKISKDSAKARAQYGTEFLGTMFFVMTIALSRERFGLQGLTIGFTLMVLIFMGGHISGGHYNPAVTAAVYLSGRKKIDGVQAASYCFFQVTGAILGAILGAFFQMNVSDEESFRYPDPVYPTYKDDAVLQAFCIEFFYTMLLALVVLNTATTKSQKDNSFFGLAIGSTIVVAAMAGGKISGGAFNPAVAIGTIVGTTITTRDDAAVTKDEPLRKFWLYLVADMLAAPVAAFIFKQLNMTGEYPDQVEGAGMSANEERNNGSSISANYYDESNPL